MNYFLLTDKSMVQLIVTALIEICRLKSSYFSCATCAAVTISLTPDLICGGVTFAMFVFVHFTLKCIQFFLAEYGRWLFGDRNKWLPFKVGFFTAKMLSFHIFWKAINQLTLETWNLQEEPSLYTSSVPAANTFRFVIALWCLSPTVLFKHEVDMNLPTNCTDLLPIF